MTSAPPDRAICAANWPACAADCSAISVCSSASARSRCSLSAASCALLWASKNSVPSRFASASAAFTFAESPEMMPLISVI
ncbi:hypothetical protein P9139_07255 [Curtobacterium flaccumfaciens]|nr:hypothetical protein P9139_07255 [Curtobacterium flaccumfaciens]